MRKYIKQASLLLFYLISAMNVLAVGEIPIEYSHSQSGGVTYSVPIQIYPGRNNFQPNLSLSYNSMSTNGVVGVGWTLNAYSVVSMVPSNVYYNNKIAAIDTNSPELVLDGIKLIKLRAEGNKILYQSEQGNIHVEKQKK